MAISTCIDNPKKPSFPGIRSKACSSSWNPARHNTPIFFLQKHLFPKPSAGFSTLKYSAHSTGGENMIRRCSQLPWQQWHRLIKGELRNAGSSAGACWNAFYLPSFPLTLLSCDWAVPSIPCGAVGDACIIGLTTQQPEVLEACYGENIYGPASRQMHSEGRITAWTLYSIHRCCYT